MASRAGRCSRKTRLHACRAGLWRVRLGSTITGLGFTFVGLGSTSVGLCLFIKSGLYIPRAGFYVYKPAAGGIATKPRSPTTIKLDNAC